MCMKYTLKCAIIIAWSGGWCRVRAWKEIGWMWLQSSEIKENEAITKTRSLVHLTWTKNETKKHDGIAE